MIMLARGQKIKLAEITPAMKLQARLELKSHGLNFDLSCFGLDSGGQLSDDRYFIFFNQKEAPQNEVVLASLSANAARFELDLARLPPTVRRLVFVATVDGVGQMSGLQTGRFVLNANGKDIGEFAFTGADFSSEKAVMVAEIYFKSEWRVGAVGQGFLGGLDSLLRHFGGEVSSPAPAPKISGAPTLPRAAPPVSPAPPLPARDPNGCVRCGKSEGFFGQVLGIGALDRATRRCKNCQATVGAAYERLRAEFNAAGQSGVLDTAQWNALWTRFESMRTGATRAQALEFLRPDALRFMERLVVMATSNGLVTPQEENYIRQMSRFLELPDAAGAPFLVRIEHVKTMARIREGHLPSVAPGDNHLDAGEICHLYLPATYQKVNARSTTLISGRLMATSKKLVFLSPVGGTVIPWKNIMTARATYNSLCLELTTRSGNGAYQVDDPQWCEAVVTTLTRMAKRQLLSPQGDNPTRHIPQDVKSAVWQRDGGRCVQCRADTYLEFDHDIPFSKGGASTVGNVQLLCRKCNGEKGAKI